MIIRLAERSIHASKTAMERARQYILENSFQSLDAEIHFFKYVKPLIYGKLIYFTKLFRIESRRPPASPKMQKKYYRKELHKLELFFFDNQDFYHYYKSSATYLDEQYFTREKLLSEIGMEPECISLDRSFNSSHDLLVAQFRAGEDLLKYLTEIAISLKQSEEQNGQSVLPLEKQGFVQTSCRAVEIYVFLKSLIDAQVILNHTYKSLFELLVPGISNLQQKSFIPTSLLKYSDKVDMEARENVKRLLQKMIRNVDSY